MLDVDVAGALGAGAKLAVYFSTFDEKGLVHCLSKVIEPVPLTILRLSRSAGAGGWRMSRLTTKASSGRRRRSCIVTKSLLAAAQLGITVCVLQRVNDGSEAQMNDGRAHVNFPATSPDVLAIGGTTLHVGRPAKGASHVTETVWNDGPNGV